MKNDFQRVCVNGLGYVGLPTAALLASRQFSVVGVDVNSSVVELINQGLVHIVEPDLDVVVRASVQSGKLRATTSPGPADVFMISVPTPIQQENKPDVSAIQSVAENIAPVLEKGNLVILESTSPVGTTDQLCQWLSDARPDLIFPHTGGNQADVQIAYCPERILPGKVIQELIENDRIVGGMSERCTQRAISFYQCFVKGTCIGTNARTSEMAKLTENSFRDVNIAFANEISILCDRFAIDVHELIDLVNRHPRVKVLSPGPGVGGHCIAVDPWFLVDSAPDDANLIRTAREVNLHKTHYVYEQICEKAGKLKHPVIACLGLAYKPDIDDLRESPSVEVVQRLAENQVGCIWVVEPYVRELPGSLQKHPCVEHVEFEKAIKGADIVVVLTDHSSFKNVDQALLKDKVILDTRGIWR